jgi:hypothetical protein
VTQGGGTWVWNDFFAIRMSTLIIPIHATTLSGASCPGTASRIIPANYSQLESTIFSNAAPPGTPTLQSQFFQCSNNKAQLNRANSMIVDPPVNLACTGRR